MLQFVTQSLVSERMVSLKAIFGFLICLCVGTLGNATAQGMSEIDVGGAASAIEAKSAFVLDVREPSEFRDGHIHDAVLIPLGQLEKRVDELAAQKDRPMIVLCGSGVRSAEAIRILSKHGFSQLQNLKGGMNAWRRAKLPIDKS